MIRPWQIWLFFFLSLAIVIPAMGWLSWQAIDLDRAESLSRQQAELEKKIGLALWRIDAQLSPLLAREAARPYYSYRSFHSAPFAKAKGENQEQRVPSPLLVQPSDLVLLHFQLYADGRLTSPQFPDQDDRQWAIGNGTTLDKIRDSGSLLSQIDGWIDYQRLVESLPEQTLSTIAAGQTVWANNVDLTSVENAQVVRNTLDFQQVQQQLAQSEDPAPQQAITPPNAQPSQSGANQSDAQRASPQAGNDFQSRNNNYQRIAQQEVFNQRVALATAAPLQFVREGVSQPLWVGSRLLLARRVETGNEIIVQGVWLNWEAIERMLADEVADLLPRLDLEPVVENSQIRVSRLLATLPVQLVAPDAVADSSPITPIRVSLVLAWSCLFVAAGAVGILLQGVITLSERRAAFVSAVTHELRTPLTTFRMYAEMLSEGMVSDPQQRQDYLDTLRVEADRLSHLVENVLVYARLERGKPGKKREKVVIDRLLDSAQSRLEDRARQAEMELVVRADDSVRSQVIYSDPAAIEQILFNLIDNACKYASACEDRRIFLNISLSQSDVLFQVRDHGPGISASEAKRLFRPFSKSAQQAAGTAPGVGLGLALCRRLARALGGRLELEPAFTEGASFLLVLPQGSQTD